MPRRTGAHDPGDGVPFDDAALILKALGHPLRLRLVCGLSRQPSNLTRIVQALRCPLSTVALHLGVLRRAGILVEERRGAEVVFQVADERVPQVLQAFCRNGIPSESWRWDELARTLQDSSV